MEDETHSDEDSLKMCGSEAGIAFSPGGGGFDCNICLEFAADPVVTLCGHLYCWPCIYKWLQRSVNTSSQHCPVCKAVLSQNTLVPLYGRGNSSKISHQNVNIPHRPSVHRESIDNRAASVIMGQYPLNGPHSSQVHHGHQIQQEYPYVNSSNDYMLPYPPLGTTGVFPSTAVGLLAGMAVDFLPLIFRNHQFSGMYYSGPYYPTGHGGSLRLRRQELELQRALHRIWVFLFCCAILCLLLF